MSHHLRALATCATTGAAGRVLALSVAITITIAPPVASAQELTVLGAASAIVELDEEDRLELGTIRLQFWEAVVHYIGACVSGGAGLAMTVAGAVSIWNAPPGSENLAATLFLAAGASVSLLAVIQLAIAIGHDLGSRDHHRNWLRDTGLAIGASVHEPGATFSF